MKFQKFEISFLIFGSILVVLFNVILVALKVLVVFEIFKETSNKSAVKFLSNRTVAPIPAGESKDVTNKSCAICLRGDLWGPWRSRI